MRLLRRLAHTLWRRLSTPGVEVVDDESIQAWLDNQV